MKANIITSKDFKIGKWSGGTTTELYISPINTEYKALNFDVRISSAKVETPESTFTNLPEVHRQLMILDGKINITHQNRYTKTLNAFELDTFEGDWQTSSIGVCTDFNVMTRGHYQSELEHFLLAKKEDCYLHIQENSLTFFVYLYSGKVKINIDQQVFPLESNQLLVLEDLNKENLDITAIENSQLIFISIK